LVFDRRFALLLFHRLVEIAFLLLVFGLSFFVVFVVGFLRRLIGAEVVGGAERLDNMGEWLALNRLHGRCLSAVCAARPRAARGAHIHWCGNTERAPVAGSIHAAIAVQKRLVDALARAALGNPFDGTFV
jgi:hypothetical protein